MSACQPICPGCVAVVTGSARNIGRAIALELAARRCGRDGERAPASRGGRSRGCRDPQAGGGRAAAEAGRCQRTRRGPQRSSRRRSNHFGRLDILVNNASIRRETDFAQLDYREWREILAITLDGAFLCTHAALPHLIASGSGAVVNIGGLSAHHRRRAPRTRRRRKGRAGRPDPRARARPRAACASR